MDKQAKAGFGSIAFPGERSKENVVSRLMIWTRNIIRIASNVCQTHNFEDLDPIVQADPSLYKDISNQERKREIHETGDAPPSGSTR
jgi:hypothetical protein